MNISPRAESQIAGPIPKTSSPRMAFQLGPGNLRWSGRSFLMKERGSGWCLNPNHPKASPPPSPYHNPFKGVNICDNIVGPVLDNGYDSNKERKKTRPEDENS
ncbi:unnamed protein product [Nezara viridula]|uniref:Uncharacterized protein n=1 Tax=Nezara viridula TaxID=85310 RepID=A0A9P0MTL5_NEZVI|nr:unnamed protein product [Nezara viridula]